VHYFGTVDDIKRNIAHMVLEKKPNAVAQDFVDILNKILSFPSMEKKKKKKCKSEKGHLEGGEVPMGRGMKSVISIRSQCINMNCHDRNLVLLNRFLYYSYRILQ